ncbi:MAG TPA: hypothetical protein ENI57_12600 [Ignavibacteria bacterium]|nr:hypothetical protein [Ignavibacteria bacterium]
MVYDKLKNGDLDIISIFLICVPNGELKPVYKNEICGGSKNKNEAFRYYYSRRPRFELLPKKPFRVKRLYLKEGIKEKDIIGFDYIE